ncbi:MAG: hypothetical protein IBX57_00495 [Gammaproteobacteria bacterium]|nr:hypothetical protein [Gammaproteobacteria bacterium]
MLNKDSGLRDFVQPMKEKGYDLTLKNNERKTSVRVTLVNDYGRTLLDRDILLQDANMLQLTKVELLKIYKNKS